MAQQVKVKNPAVHDDECAALFEQFNDAQVTQFHNHVDGLMWYAFHRMNVIEEDPKAVQAETFEQLRTLIHEIAS